MNPVPKYLQTLVKIFPKSSRVVFDVFLWPKDLSHRVRIRRGFIQQVTVGGLVDIAPRRPRDIGREKHDEGAHGRSPATTGAENDRQSRSPRETTNFDEEVYVRLDGAPR